LGSASTIFPLPSSPGLARLPLGGRRPAGWMATIHHSPPRRRTTTPPAENSRALFAVGLPATELRRDAGLPAAGCRCRINGALIQERCIRRAGKLHRKG